MYLAELNANRITSPCYYLFVSCKSLVWLPWDLFVFVVIDKRSYINTGFIITYHLVHSKN